MSAYLIADVSVSNPQQYEDYKRLSSQAMAEHGAKVLVRGGQTQRLEGREPGRTVLLEFPSVEAAQAFYESETYRAARQAREGAAVMNMFIVQGI